MSKYIVTGASGFVGINLVKKLATDKSNFVYAVVRNEKSNVADINTLQNVKIMQCEMQEIDSLYAILKDENIKSFFHLAWEGTTGSLRADYEIQMRNVIYAVKAFELSEKLSCEKFLCAGTISEHLIEQIEKLSNISQNMIYALAKKTTCELLRIMAKKSSVDLVWMQFSNVYGPNNKSGNLISYAVREIKAGRIPQFGSGLQPYNFIYIDDLVSAICCLEEADLKKDYYFIGSEEIMNLKDYLVQIPIILHKDIEMGIGQRPDDGLSYKKEWFDISDLKQDTLYTVQYTFELGIKSTFVDN